MSEAIQQPASVPAQPAPPRPFEKPDSGADYLATEEHYLSLAGRIAAALGQGCCFALVTGEPPPDPPLLSSALATTAAGFYAVLSVPRGSKFSFEEMLRAVPGHFGEQPQLVPSKLPLLVLGEADNLTDEQFDALFGVLISTDKKKAAAVLSGSPALVTRLQALKPRMFDGGAAATFRLQELGREEIEAFVRRQLHGTDSKAGVFTAEAIGAVADFSGGDPVLANRLSRLMIELADGAGAKQREHARSMTEPPGSSTPETVPESGDALAAAPVERRHFWAWWSSRTPSHRRRGIRVFQAVFLLCVAGFLIIVNSDQLLSFARLAQREIARFTTQNFDVRVKIEAPDLSGATASPPKAPAVELPAKELLALENSLAPPTLNEGTEARSATDTPSRPATSAVNLAPEPEHRASALVTMPGLVVPPEPNSQPAGSTIPAISEQIGKPRLPPSEIAALVARGDALVSTRDLASARLFYERAAEMGDGRGALRMGMTFDPAFLARAAIRGGQGDQQQALSWYRRARDLGDAEAERLLQKLGPH